MEHIIITHLSGSKVNQVEQLSLSAARHEELGARQGGPGRKLYHKETGNQVFQKVINSAPAYVDVPMPGRTDSNIYRWLVTGRKRKK